MRTLIIGDIHGCSGALRRLLQKFDPGSAEDRLILLGDLFDRGPDSWQVPQDVKKLEAAWQDRFVLLRGNHEDYLFQKKMTIPMRMMWDRVGRMATVRSFQEHGERMEDSAPWLEEHSVLFYKDPRFCCVHAGMVVFPPEVNDLYTLLHDHDIVLENRYKGPLAITGHIALPSAVWFAGDKKTTEKLPEEKWQSLPRTGTICIDTGCGKGGSLTGMLIEGDQYLLRSAGE